MESPRTTEAPAPTSANRDLFRLAVLVVALFAMLLVVLGIAAFNSRFIFLPLPVVPRHATAANGFGVNAAIVVQVKPPRAAGIPRAESISS